MFKYLPRAAAVSMLLAFAAVLAACEGGGPVGPQADAARAPTDALAAAQAAPVTATFAKEFMADEGSEMLLVWHGSLTLDGVTGDLVSMIDLTAPGTLWAGATLHATVHWVVTGDLEIVFETKGVVNFANGIVRTNGIVVSGPYSGSQVHQQGQLEGLDASGFLRIHPMTGA